MQEPHQPTIIWRYLPIGFSSTAHSGGFGRPEVYVNDTSPEGESLRTVEPTLLRGPGEVINGGYNPLTTLNSVFFLVHFLIGTAPPSPLGPAEAIMMSRTSLDLG